MDAWGMEGGLDGPEGMTFALHGWGGYDTRLGGSCHGICTCGPVGWDLMRILLLPVDVGYVQLKSWTSRDWGRCPALLLCRQMHAGFFTNPPKLEKSGRAKLFSIG